MDMSIIKMNDCLKPSEEWTNIHRLLSQVVLAQSTSAAKKEIKVALSYTEEMAKVDGQRLQQICNTLLEIAIRYSSEHNFINIDAKKTDC
jgi:K+-sensing histidine kinase KdpD